MKMQSVKKRKGIVNVDGMTTVMVYATNELKTLIGSISDSDRMIDILLNH